MSGEGAEMVTLSPAAPVSLPDDHDLLREILLRLPPQPSSLLRAYSVCKLWQCLVTDPRFLRSFLAHHRKPPLLGAFDQPEQLVFTSTQDTPNRIPSGRFSDDGVHGEHLLLGCRHGRVLVRTSQHGGYIVFDPITRERFLVDAPPESERFYVTATVLCAAGDRDHVHGACHSSPFKVAVTMHREYHQSLARVYSSDTGVWGNLISMAVPPPFLVCPTADPAILSGNALYWLLAKDGILEFDLDKQSLTVIEGPPDIDSPHQRVIQAEDGGVGLAVLSYPSFQVWERKLSSHGVANWVLRKTVNMQNILSIPPNTERWITLIVGYSEDAHVMFLFLGTGFYMVQLDSMKGRRLDELCHLGSVYHPFTSFYTPGTAISGGPDRAEMLHGVWDDCLV